MNGHLATGASIVSGSSKKKGLLVSLQYIRAVSVMAVVYFHAVLQVRLFSGDHTFLPLVGAGAVDVFFVLSGFMMRYAIDQVPSTSMEFLRRRIVRIAPLYWIVTLAALAIACAVPGLLRSTVCDPAHAIASLLFVPWKNPAAVALGSGEIFVPVVVPGWTLNFEMMFYLIFAFTLRAPERIRNALLAATLLALFAASSLVSRAGSAFSFYHNSVLFEFLIGSSLGAMRLHQRPIKGLAALCLAVLGGGALIACEVAGLPHVPRILLFGLPATIVMVAALRAEAAGIVKVMPRLNALGDASFSIYLTHGFVLAGLRVATMKSGLRGDTFLFQIAFMLVSLIIAAVIGLAVYRLVERPMVRAADRWSTLRFPRRRLQTA
jgi:exopolysaccharide production protein ExoZ